MSKVTVKFTDAAAVGSTSARLLEVTDGDGGANVTELSVLVETVLRLPLGKDCYDRAVRSHKARWKDLEAVEAVALSVNSV